ALARVAFGDSQLRGCILQRFAARQTSRKICFCRRQSEKITERISRGTARAFDIRNQYERRSFTVQAADCIRARDAVEDPGPADGRTWQDEGCRTRGAFQSHDRTQEALQFDVVARPRGLQDTPRYIQSVAEFYTGIDRQYASASIDQD